MIEDKLLSGYWYRASSPGDDNNRSLNLNTGMGGAKMLIDEFRKGGVPDKQIEEIIEVYIQGMWVKLAHLNTIKREKTDEIKKEDLKLEQKVRLFEFPENDIPEQDATIYSTEGVEVNGMIVVQVEPEDESDDGIRECHISQIKFIYE